MLSYERKYFSFSLMQISKIFIFQLVYTKVLYVPINLIVLNNLEYLKIVLKFEKIQKSMKALFICLQIWVEKIYTNLELIQIKVFFFFYIIKQFYKFNLYNQYIILD